MSKNAAPKGQVKITKGNETSYVLPESVAVWERNGWKAVQPDKGEAQNDTKQVTTTDGEKQTVTK